MTSEIQTMKGIVGYDPESDPLTRSGYYIKSENGDLYASSRCDLMTGDMVEFRPTNRRESQGLPYASDIVVKERIANATRRA